MKQKNARCQWTRRPSATTCSPSPFLLATEVENILLRLLSLPRTIGHRRSMPKDLQEDARSFGDPFGLVNLPRGSERVEDPEEEVCFDANFRKLRLKHHTSFRSFSYIHNFLPVVLRTDQIRLPDWVLLIQNTTNCS